MISSALVDRWARAIFELGVESNKLTELSAEIGRVAAVYGSSKDLKAVLDNPLVAEDKRDALIRELGTRLGLSELATNSLRLLARRRRLIALPDIATRLASMADEREGVLRATVISASALGDDFYERLRQKLERKTGKKVVISRQQDPALIAGVITRIGDNTIDGSLRGRLQALERQLLTS